MTKNKLAAQEVVKKWEEINGQAGITIADVNASGWPSVINFQIDKDKINRKVHSLNELLFADAKISEERLEEVNQMVEKFTQDFTMRVLKR